QILRHTDRTPYVLPIRGVDQHTSHRPGSLRLVEYPNLEVDKIDVLEMRVNLCDRIAQRPIQSVHRPIPLGRAHIPLAASVGGNPNLDRPLRGGTPIGMLFDDPPPCLPL